MPKGHYDRSLKLAERFWAKVDKSGPIKREGLTNCWTWTGSTDGRLASGEGYGKFCFNNKSVRAHRVAYMLTNGEIGEGLCIMHICDNPQCVNPEHLRQGTHIENMRDKVAKGRCNAAKYPRDRLTNEQVLAIYHSTKPNREIAREMEIKSVSSVRSIKNGKSYSHITGATPSSSSQRPSLGACACRLLPPPTPSQTEPSEQV